MQVGEHHFSESDLSFQVVIKFADGFYLPCDDLNAKHDTLLDDSFFFQSRIFELFPGIRIRKLFTSVKEDQINRLVKRARRNCPEYNTADFFSYYSINCPGNTNPKRLLKTLSEERNIVLAYVENVPTIAPSIEIDNSSCSGLSNYLLPAPIGMNALYAWNFPGGDGAGKVKFIDIELGWLLEHECIHAGTFPCTGMNDYHFREHGIAVLGIIMMNENNSGIGITPKAKGFVVSQWRPDGLFNTADAIMAAISQLQYGDILLLEMQCFDSATSSSLWPIEIQEAVFQTIKLASALGIIVIETAGNGNLKSRAGNDLDNFHFNSRKIFDRHSVDFRESGAILVGACSNGLPHRRTSYTNFGNRIDCFAYGENVITAGNFPGSSGMSVNTYTHHFGGTSAAAAIITGAAIAIQNISEKSGSGRLSPQEMRSVLGNELYNTVSANGKSNDKIGVMPDLKKIINKRFSNKKLRKVKTGIAF